MACRQADDHQLCDRTGNRNTKKTVKQEEKLKVGQEGLCVNCGIDTNGLDDCIECDICKLVK